MSVAAVLNKNEVNAYLDGLPRRWLLGDFGRYLLIEGDVRIDGDLMEWLWDLDPVPEAADVMIFEGELTVTGRIDLRDEEAPAVLVRGRTRAGAIAVGERELRLGACRVEGLVWADEVTGAFSCTELDAGMLLRGPEDLGALDPTLLRDEGEIDIDALQARIVAGPSPLASGSTPERWVGPVDPSSPIREAFDKRMLAAFGGPDRPLSTLPESKLAAQCADHGVACPQDLEHFFRLREELAAKGGVLGEWRVEEREFWRPDPMAGNRAEQLILADQGNWLGTFMIEYFCWCVRLGSMGNGDVYFASFLPTQLDEPEVVCWDHEERDMSQTFARTIPDLAFANLLLAEVVEDDGPDEGFSQERLRRDARRIAGRTQLSWHFRRLESVAEVDTRCSGSSVAPLLYYRALWIIRLLMGDEHESLPETAELFGLVNVPWDSLDVSIGNGRLLSIPPHAHYWLWRLFFFNRDTRLREVIEMCKGSSNQMIADMAALVEELQDGRRQLGLIDDIHAIRERFLALDLDPDRAEERAREQRIRREAAEARREATREALAKFAAAGDAAGFSGHAWTIDEPELALEAGAQLAELAPEVALELERLHFLRDGRAHRDGKAFNQEVDELYEVLSASVHPLFRPVWVAYRRHYALAKMSGVWHQRVVEDLRAMMASRTEFNHDLAYGLLGIARTGVAPRFIDELLPLAEEFAYDARDSTAQYGRKNVLKALFEALAASGDPRAVEPMARFVRERHPDLAARALRCLGRLGLPAAAEVALEVLESPLRRPAMYCLARVGDGAALERIRAINRRRVGEASRRAYEELMESCLANRLNAEGVVVERAAFALMVVEANRFEAEELHEMAVDLLAARADAATKRRLLLPRVDHEFPEVRARILDALGADAPAVHYYDRAHVDLLYAQNGAAAVAEALAQPGALLRHNLLRKLHECNETTYAEAAVSFGDGLLSCYPHYAYAYERDAWERLKSGVAAIAGFDTPATDEFAARAMSSPSAMIRKVFHYGFDALKQRVGPPVDTRVAPFSAPQVGGARAPWALGAKINGLCFTPDRERVVVVGGASMAHGVAAIFDRNGRVVRSLPAVRGWAYDVDIHPDGRLAAVGLHAGHLLLIDLESGELLEALRGHGAIPHGVRKVRFSPDGARLASASCDRSLLVYDVATREVIRRWDLGFDVNAVDWMPDGNHLVFGTDKQLGIVDVDGLMTAPRCIDRPTFAIRVFDGGRCIAAGGPADDVVIVDAQLELLQRLEQSKVSRIRVSTDAATLIAISYEGQDPARMWCLKSGTSRVLPAPGPQLYALDLDPDSGVVCAGGHGGNVNLWDSDGKELITGSSVAHTAAVKQITSHNEGLWSAGAEGMLIHWGPDGSPLRCYASPGDSFSAVALSKDRRLVLGTGSAAVAFEVESGAVRWRVEELQRSNVAAATEGMFVVGSGATLVWLDADSGQVVDTYDTGSSSWLIHSVEAPDGTWWVGGYRDSVLHRIDLGARALVGRIELPERLEDAESYGVGAGGSTLVVSRWDRSFDVFDLKEPPVHRVEVVDLLALNPVAVSPDDRWVAAGDGEVYVYRLPDFVCVGRYVAGASVESLTFVDGERLALGLASGELRIVELPIADFVGVAAD